MIQLTPRTRSTMAIVAWCTAFFCLNVCVGKTYVVPHLLEKSGRISDTPYTFDTTLFLTYNAAIGSNGDGSAQVELYLYDNSGAFMKGAASTVCGPCMFQLDAQHRKLSVSLDDLINTNGGGFDQGAKVGFGVIVVSGVGEDAVNLQVMTANSHTNANDLEIFSLTPEALQPPHPSGTVAGVRTYVIPHVLETSGKSSTSQYAFDHIVYAAYTSGLPGGHEGNGALLSIYLYDDAGKPMLSETGTEVCNPCMFELGAGAGAAQRKQSIRVDDLIALAGGFGAQEVKTGFAVIVVGGEDPEGVNLQGFVVNSHTGPFDLSINSSAPEPVRSDPPVDGKRVFVMPHILEKSGTINDTTYTFDTTLVATYASGLAGITNGGGASLDLYLYDNSGAPMVGLTGTPVCNPCSYALGPGGEGTPPARKLSIRIDDLIASRGGGFDAAVKLGFGVMVVGGADPEGVNLQGFVVNAHTSPFDLSVFGFEPQPLAAARMAAGSKNPTGGLASKAFVLPHVLERSGTIASSPYTFDTTLFATYAGGLPGNSSTNSATLRLYLYDSVTGLPLRGAQSEVCNPCMFDLSSENRKLSIRIDDLIVDRGGGFGVLSAMTAEGLVVLGGDASDVNLECFVVNSHTGPFDLSVFGFDPQPIAAAGLRPMPVEIAPVSGAIELVIPTVIGGQYVIEAQDNLGGTDWNPIGSFDGDGTVQRFRVLQSTGQQFIRVRGS